MAIGRRITRCMWFATLTKMLGFASHFAYTDSVIGNLASVG